MVKSSKSSVLNDQTDSTNSKERSVWVLSKAVSKTFGFKEATYIQIKDLYVRLTYIQIKDLYVRTSMYKHS